MLGQQCYQYEILVHTFLAVERSKRVAIPIHIHIEHRFYNTDLKGYGYYCYGSKPSETNVRIKRHMLA